MSRGKEDPERLSERMGQTGKARPEGLLIWCHAASVGEAQSALILIERLQKTLPDAHILVTSGTLTSAQLMNKRLSGNAFHQFIPVDHPRWVERFLDHWKPDLALWMESELWPNMLDGIRGCKIPAALINARLSEKSFKRWSHMKGWTGSLLSTFSLILAQTQQDGIFYKTLTQQPETVFVTDNLKYSAAPLPYDEAALSDLKQAIGERPVWLYASTHDGEETLACRVHKALSSNWPDLLTIIVPRHPERRDAIAETCKTNQLSYRLRGEEHKTPESQDSVYIADTLGELGLFYSLAPIAMIGRSFSNDGGGGHNPVEAAQLNCAVLTGPNIQFQQQIFDDMKAHSAVLQVHSEEELTESIRNLLTNPARCAELSRAARDFAEQKNTVIERVVCHLQPLLNDIERNNKQDSA